MAWLRVDDGFTENAKIAELTDREFRIWIRTLCYAARNNGKRGRLTPAMRREIVGLSPGLVSKLKRLGLLDTDDDPGVLSIHDWDTYNPKDPSHAARQARYRGRQSDDPRDGSSDVEGDAPRDADSDAPRAGTRARPVPSPSPTPDPEEQLGVKDLNAVVPRPGPLDRLLEVLHDKDKYTKSVLLALHREFQLSEGDFEWARECATGPGVKSPTRVAVAELKKRVLEKAST